MAFGVLDHSSNQHSSRGDNDSVSRRGGHTHSSTGGSTAATHAERTEASWMRTVMKSLLCTAGLRVRVQGPGSNVHRRTLHSSSILPQVQCGRLHAVLCTAGSGTQHHCCFFLSLSYRTEPPTPGRIAKVQGDSNLEARGSAPRGRLRKKCVNAPVITRCCPMPAPRRTCLLS